MDYILRHEDLLHTESNGYAVFYPNDGYMTDLSSRESAEQHLDNLHRYFPDAYVVRVQIERV